MLKACIIGVSGYGKVHYDLLMHEAAAGTMRIVGAAIINQDEEAEKCARLRELGCRIFDDYQVMLDELAGTAEFCMIPTGTPLHRSMTVAALEAGMHVLVEKPAAGCLEDVRAMQQAAQQAGKVVAVGYQHMYTPAARKTKESIRNGTIGRVESIKCLVLWPRDHAYYHRNGWAGKLDVGGTPVNDSPFNNAVAHELLMMLFLAGPESRRAALPVSVEAELYRANAIESADTACMRVETGEGVPIHFYATHASQEFFGPEIHIRGTQGSIIMTHQGTVITPDAGAVIRLASGGGEAQRQAMMEAVRSAVQGGSAFYCDLDMAACQTAVVHAIHQACPIHSVAGRTVTSENNAVRTILPGLDEVMRRAFDRECLFHAAGAPWAKPSTKTNVKGS